MKTNTELFTKHVNLGTFIETGTCFGRSVAIAVALGYTNIRSVEASPDRYNHCVELFKDNPSVQLWCGESPDVLPTMVADLNEPALFFLDAHPSGPEGYGQDFKTNPVHHQSNILKAELLIVARHRVGNHVVLVDDLTPDIEEFARNLFSHRNIEVHDTDEGPHKVMEIS